MARGGGKKKQAPAEWQGAVDASEAKDEKPKGGVKHDGAGPFVEEPLDAETLAVQAHEMARLVGERTKVDQQRLDALRKYGKELKGLDDRIEKLAKEVESGVRRVPAQKDLPGTVAA